MSSLLYIFIYIKNNNKLNILFKNNIILYYFIYIFNNYLFFLLS